MSKPRTVMRDLDGNVDDGTQEGEELENQQQENEGLSEHGDQTVEIVEDEEDEDDNGDKARSSQQEDDDDDDDDLPKSKAVKKRIHRERRRWEGVVSEKDREIERLRGQVDTLTKDSTKQSMESIDQRIESTRSALRTAKEAGDTDAELKLTEDLADLRADKKILERIGASGQQSYQQPDSRGQQQQTRVEPNAARDQWLEDNDWFDQPGHEVDSQIVRAIDQDLYRRGMDPKSPEYFKALDKELKKRGISVNDDDDDDKPDPKAKRKQRVADGRSSAPSGRGKGTLVISKSEAERMRQFRLDPKNPEHVRRWIRENRNG